MFYVLIFTFMPVLFALSQTAPGIERHFSGEVKVQPAANHFRSGDRTPCVLASCGQDAQDPRSRRARCQAGRVVFDGATGAAILICMRRHDGCGGGRRRSRESNRYVIAREESGSVWDVATHRPTPRTPRTVLILPP